MNEQDLRLVRLLSGHFPSLQGLNMVLFGPVQALWGLAWLSTHSEAGTAALMLSSFLAIYWPGKRLERYYAERFGRVEAPRTYLRDLFITGLIVPWLLHDRWHPIGPCLAILWLGIHPARLVVESWPYRNHHLFTVAASVLGAVAAFHVASAYDALAQAFVLIGLVEMPCGFADHALLVRAMAAMKTREVHAVGDSQNAEGYR